MFSRRLTQIVVSVLAVAILLLSSSDLANLHLPVSGVHVDSSGTSPPPVPFLPYVLDPSNFPTPDTLLNGTENISHPHLSVVSYLNQSIYEVVYTATDPYGNSTVFYLNGRYDPTLAACVYYPANCTGKTIPHSPINWSAPKTILTLLHGTTVLDDAIGASGGTTMVAVTTNNQKTQVWTGGSFGLNRNWTSITPIPISGVSPRLVVSPCTAFLTTTSSSVLTATTFSLPCGLPQTPPSGGGGDRGAGPGSGPPPFVSQILPNSGQVGTPVTVVGGNFAAGATVKFGTTAAWTVQYVDPAHITCVAPPGTSTVDVTVSVNGQTSGIVPADRFTYVGPSPPAVQMVTPGLALPNATVNVSGANFAAGAQVFFGGTAARSVTYRSSTLLSAVVPWGIGTVDVRVLVAGLYSTFNPGDHFTFAVAQATLPPANSASPVLLPNPTVPSGVVEGIVATDTGTSTVRFYNSTDHGSTFASGPIGSFALSTGSPLFSRLASTQVFLAGGLAGLTAAVSVGNVAFSLFTTQLENRTVVETSGSTDGGHTWTGPYVSAPLVGTVSYPALATSPEGYVYATWLENGAGPWQLDQAVFAESGRLLYGPTPIPGTGGAVGSSAISPSVAVDGLGRPLYLWEWTNATSGLTQLRSTGAFGSAAATETALASAFHNAQPWDFVVQGSSLSTFSAQVNSSLSNVTGAITAGKTCTVQSRVTKQLAPLVTLSMPKATYYGIPGGCGIVVPAPNSKLTNSSGPFAADTYLAVYLDWLAEASGFGKLLEPYWPGAPGNPFSNSSMNANPPNPAYPPDNQWAPASSSLYYASVNPVTVNPNALWLNLTGWAGTLWSNGRAACNPPYNTKYITTSFTDAPVAQTTVVKINGGGGGLTYTLHGFWPSAYVTNLSAGTTGTWSETITVTYQETKSLWDACDSSQNRNNTVVTPINSGWPSSFTVTLNGNYTTFEETVPGGLIVHEVGNKTVGTNAYDYVAWNNSILSVANTSIRGSGYSYVQNSPFYQTIENTGQFNITLSKSYTAWANLTSEPGGTNSSWPNQLNTGLDGGFYAAAETSWTSCSFSESPNPILIHGPTANWLQNVTTSGATLTWYSNTPGRGWISYNDSSDGVYTQTAQQITDPNHPAGYAYGYRLQLHGLSPWGLYRVTVGVSSFNGCLEYDNGAAWYIQVLSLVQLQEMEYPYDSITHEGGGARVTWSVPSQFASAARFVNGSFSYFPWNSTTQSWNTSATVQVPFSSLSSLSGGAQFVYYWVNSTFQVNLTELALNTSYNASVILNYNLSGQAFQASSDPFVWTYAKDTSGDGLTDWEKLRGWEVTTQSATGAWSTTSVVANPSVPATNGLVNDFLEKEYGLDPTRLDSAGSYMLDTWNLTFDLGTNASNPATPAQFQVWSELGHYNFSRYCAYPGQAPSACIAQTTHSRSTEPTNLSDNSPWAARVLWSNSDLTSFESVMAKDGESWLRGVLGTTVITVSGAKTTVRTLTVEGKLSWGANPLAASTPLNGVPDGYRLNPLGTIDVQLKILNWTATGLSQGDGVATYEHSWSPAAPYYSGTTGYSGYTKQVTAGSGGKSLYGGTFTVTFPVTPTEQYVNLNLSLVQNHGGTYSSAVSTANLSVDLANSSWKLGYSVSGSNKLGYEYQAFCVYSKAPTYIFVPEDNSTLSSMPLGLQRYVGEQNFVLLVVNDTINGTNSLSVGSVPYLSANGSVSAVTYTVALSGGLDNLLVPRAYLLRSPLGQALLNGTNVSVAHSASNGFIQSYWDPQTWYARVTGKTSWNGSDYAPGTTGYVRVFSNASQNCSVNPSLCGGVPANPSVEQAQPSLALQGILTLNVTNLNQLDGILAGLLLNRSGNFTGWLLGATAVLPSLGLPQGVLRALGNASFANDGSYGAPKSSQPKPASWTSLAGSIIWNAVSGVVGAVSVVWNSALAGVAYASKLVQIIAGWGLAALNQVAGVLKAVAGAILWALEQLATWLIQLVQGFLSLLSQTIGLLVRGYATGISTALGWVFQNLTASSPSISQSMAAVGYLLLAFIGMFGVVETISQGISWIMTTLQPVLSLVNPQRIAQLIGGAFGSSEAQGPISSIFGAMAAMPAAAMGLISDGLAGMASGLVDESQIPSLPSGMPAFPTGSQINGFGSSLVSGYPSLASDFGNLLSTSYSAVTIGEIIHVGLIVALLVFLVMNQLFITSVPRLPAFAAAYVPQYGGAVPNIVTLTKDIVLESFGLLISVAAVLLESFFNWVWELMLTIAGAAIATFETVLLFMHSIVFPQGGAAVLAIAGVSAGASWIPPVLLWATNA